MTRGKHSKPVLQASCIDGTRLRSVRECHSTRNLLPLTAVVAVVKRHLCDHDDQPITLVREVAGLHRRRFALRRDGRDIAHIQMGLADGRMEHSGTGRDPADSPLFVGPVVFTSAFDDPCCVRRPRPGFDRLRPCASTRRLSLTRERVGDPSNSRVRLTVRGCASVRQCHPRGPTDSPSSIR
jgi:hypothetical protein